MFSCLSQQVQISDDFCGMEVNTPLDGAVPIDAAPLLVYPNTLLTAVSAVSTHDYTVCFLGTSDGHLKKVRRRLRPFTSRCFASECPLAVIASLESRNQWPSIGACGWQSGEGKK